MTKTLDYLKSMIKPSTASKEHLPVIKKASGKYVWDIEGKKYLDFNMANLTCLFGYKKLNFKHPPNFSGKTYLEDETSKQLSKFTKTKYWRYFKTGSDAVLCSIRLARNILGKRNASIGFIGYHGSNNEYVYTTDKNAGIPYQNSIQFKEGMLLDSVDILVFESRFSHIAEQITSQIMICDHLKSGIMGLKEKTYDIDLYGKSLGAGYAISAMTGKDRYMSRINEIYYSGTFSSSNDGFEAILTSLKKFQDKKYQAVLKYAHKKLPKWRSLNKQQIDYFLDKNIIFNGYWFISMAHSKKDIDILKSEIDKALFY